MSDDESHLLPGDWQDHPCIWSLDNLSRISWNTEREAYGMQGELSKMCNLRNSRLIKEFVGYEAKGPYLLHQSNFLENSYWIWSYRCQLSQMHSQYDSLFDIESKRLCEAQEGLEAYRSSAWKSSEKYPSQELSQNDKSLSERRYHEVKLDICERSRKGRGNVLTSSVLHIHTQTCWAMG